jgi:hypothetical protein
MFLNTTWQVVSSVVQVPGLVNYLAVVIVPNTQNIIKIKH